MSLCVQKSCTVYDIKLHVHTLLIKVNPAGPVCHTGTDTCWGEENKEDIMFLKELQDFIDKRHEEMPGNGYRSL